MNRLSRLFVEQCTIQRAAAAGVDGYGNTTTAPGTPIPTVGYHELKESVEYLNDQQTTVSKWIAYLPAGTAVSALDTITFAGVVFSVDGEPWPVVNPRTNAVSHVQCKLVVVT